MRLLILQSFKMRSNEVKCQLNNGFWYWVFISLISQINMAFVQPNYTEKKMRKWSGLSDDIRSCSVLSWSEPSSIRSLTLTVGFRREWLWGSPDIVTGALRKWVFPVVVEEEVSVRAAWQGIWVGPSDKQKGHGTTTRNRILLAAGVSLQSLQTETRSKPVTPWAECLVTPYRIGPLESVI